MRRPATRPCSSGSSRPRIDGKPGPIRIEYVQHFRPKLTAPAAPAPAPEAAPPPPPPAPVDERTLVRGRMREKGTRDPIGGASVALTVLEGETPVELFASTADDGRFEVKGGAAPGLRLRLVISSGEHEPCVREVTAPAPGDTVPEVNCIVAPHVMSQYETVIINPGEGEEATKHTVTQSEMTTVPGTFGDPLRVIQNLPGIARMPYGLGLLIVRGSSPQDSGVYVDGHRVPLLYHFLGGPSVLTPDLIDQHRLLPGRLRRPLRPRHRRRRRRDHPQRVFEARARLGRHRRARLLGLHRGAARR